MASTLSAGRSREYKFNRPVEVDRLKEGLRNAGVDAVIQQFDQAPGVVMIRSSADTYGFFHRSFRRRSRIINSRSCASRTSARSWGKALRRDAMLAIVFALGGILVYVEVSIQAL